LLSPAANTVWRRNFLTGGALHWRNVVLRTRN
jgi:hypothetical protein